MCRKMLKHQWSKSYINYKQVTVNIYLIYFQHLTLPTGQGLEDV